jgi:hypothetical protein
MANNRKKYKFSGHQTFPFRYGWLEKGVREIERKSTAFSEPDALVKLGVGKNMVDSIRHWCLLTQLVELDANIRRETGRYLKPTHIAEKLMLGEKPWDPFLEDDATLWLIHWLIISNPLVGTTWQLMFSRFFRPDFTKQEVVSFLIGFTQKNSIKVKESVLKRDVDCFLHTYVTGLSGKKLAAPEEGFSSPLLELGLIQITLDGELFRFAIGPKLTLSAGVFGYALDQYFRHTRGTRKTMSIQDCLYGEGSPGQAFKLDENSIVDYVETLETMTEGAIGLDETAGVKQIYFRHELEGLDLLAHHYAAGGLP